jgi:hypothetical protein
MNGSMKLSSGFLGDTSAMMRRVWPQIKRFDDEIASHLTCGDRANNSESPDMLNGHLKPPPSSADPFMLWTAEPRMQHTIALARLAAFPTMTPSLVNQESGFPIRP